MLNENVLFSNLFRSEKITPSRLYTFSVVVLAALKLANDNGRFDAIIAALSSSLDTLQNELADVDTNLSGQKVETRTVDQFIYDFYTFMGESEPFIARALGGYTSAGYLAFYPNKQSEYTRATKTTMQTLADRIERAAKKWGSKLDADMNEKLLSFAPDFKKQYATQQEQINTVKSDRDERGAAAATLQLVLTQTVMSVGAAFPGNVAKCASFFPFKMLYPQRKRTLYTLKGSLQKEESKTLLLMNLTKNVEITLLNTGDVANYAFWLAASPTDPMPKDALIITVSSDAMKLKASDMPGFNGVSSNYMIKNLSNEAVCSYQVSFAGVRKKIANAEVTTEYVEMKVMSA